MRIKILNSKMDNWRKVNLGLAIFLLLLFLLFMVSCGEKQGPDLAGEGNKGETSHSDYDLSWVAKAVMPEESGTSRGLENFESLDIHGNPVNSEIFSDYKITIVDVWGTYCGPCIKAMPTLAALYEKYEGQGVNVVGIMIDVQGGDLLPKKEYIARAMEITEGTGADVFTHILSSQNILSSVLSSISAIPASFLVDSQGNVITKIQYGGRTFKQWEDLINEYI